MDGWTWDALTAQWEEGFAALLRYVEDNGDARVPRSCVADGFRLGQWAQVQRTSHAKGRLEADRERRLLGLPGWTWDPIADQWEEAFRVLLRYVEDNGDARVPAPYIVDGYPLGKWVRWQRSLHAQGTLEADRERRLLGLPGWTWHPYADKWEEGFAALLRYVEDNGHAIVPASCVVDGYLLGKWVDRQRTFHAKGRLEPDRERRLLGLPGWTWDAIADQWEEGFAALLRYVEDNGDARVPAPCIVDGFRLGQWVSKQRQLHRKGRLEADRERRLLGLPGWTRDPHADNWEEGFAALLRYVEDNGDARVPASCVVDGYPLGNWVVRQRSLHAQGTLDADRERRLLGLPGTLDADRERRLLGLPGWTRDALTPQWEEGFAALLRYVEDNGHALVPQSCAIDGFPLGQWVSNQRQSRRRGTLDTDRERRLLGLPGWTWDALTAQWEEGFAALLRYVEENGHARVPTSCVVDGFPLGQWVSNQRQSRRRGTLDADRESRLRVLPGWIWKVK